MARVPRRRLAARGQFEPLEARHALAANLAIQGAELVTAGGTVVTSVVYGEEVYIRARWTSTDLTASNAYVVRMTLDGIPLDSTVTGQAGVNVALSRIRGGWFAGTGPKSVSVVIDADIAVAETNESDNSTTVNFTPVAPTTLPQKLIWPIPTLQNADWSIHNYVDVDPRPDQRRDFNGGGFQYEGHDAFDAVVGNYGQMDKGTPVYAAATGTVTSAVDGNYDRERVTSGRPANAVFIDHGSGWSTRYLHLMENTVAVKAGDVVKTGQLLGFVGSSGNSTAAHLHFGLRKNGAIVEPMFSPSDYFVSPQVYQPNTTMQLYEMGTTVFDGFTNGDAAERVNNVDQIPTGYVGNIYTWFSPSHIVSTDSLQLRWYRPGGTLANTTTLTASTGAGGWYYAFTQRNWETGNWQAAVMVNNIEKGRTNFTVGNTFVPELRLLDGATYILDERTTPIDFGSVNVNGAAITRTFTIENRGFNTLTPGNLSLPDGFSLSGTFPSNIAAAGQATFTLRLDTTTPGRKFGAVRFTSNDPDEGTFTFNIEGTVNGSLSAGTPVVTFPGAQLPYHFGMPLKPLDPTATLSDSDSSNFNGSILSANIVSGATSNDRLAVRHEGTGAGQIGVSGANVTYGGTLIGTANGGIAGQALLITLNASAGLAATQALLRNIAYENLSPTDLRHPRYACVTLTEATLLRSAAVYRTVLPVVYELPTISAIADQTITTGGTTTGDVPFIIGDVDKSLGITLTATSSNPAFLPAANIVFGGAGQNRTVRATPATGQSGSSLVTVAAADPNGALVTETYTVSLTATNTPPTIGNVANQTINEDGTTGALAFTVGDAQTAAGALTLSASTNNAALLPLANIVFGGSGANRTVTATPLGNQSGTVTITVTVSDGAATAQDSFQVLVNPVNDDPTISNITDKAVNEDASTGAITFTVGDLETAAGALNVTATSTNLALVPNANIVLGGSGANRTITVTPLPNQSGATTIMVTVNDGVATAQDTFQVVVSAVNSAPTISVIPNQQIFEDASTTLLAITVADEETAAAALTLSATSNNAVLLPPSSYAFSGSGGTRFLQITPAHDQFGSATITVTVSDGATTAQRQFNLVVDPVNDAPTISAISVQSTPEEVAIVGLPFTIGDAETAAGSLNIIVTATDGVLLPASGLQVQGTGASRTLRIAPALNAFGSATVRVTVSDGVNTAIEEFLVVVQPVNDPPGPLSLSPASVRGWARGAVVGDLSAADVDGDTITFSTTDARFEIVAGKLKLRPDAWLDPSVGTVSVEVTATDSAPQPLSRTETKLITVLANPTPWLNPRKRFDVDDDNVVVPLDALLIIIELNAAGAHTLVTGTHILPGAYFDVSGDNHVGPLDAVLIINALNAGDTGEGEAADAFVDEADWSPEPVWTWLDEERTTTTRRKK